MTKRAVGEPMNLDDRFELFQFVDLFPQLFLDMFLSLFFSKKKRWEKKKREKKNASSASGGSRNQMFKRMKVAETISSGTAHLLA